MPTLSPKERIRDASRKILRKMGSHGESANVDVYDLADFLEAIADEMDRQIAFDKAREAAKG
jgi:hypothetical protein